MGIIGASLCEEEPIIEVDVEYVCNTDTGFYDEITTTTTDGIPGDPVIEATTIACVAQPEPVVETDIEYVCDEATDTWQSIITVFVDGVEDSVTGPTDTGIACADEPADIIDVDTELICNTDTGFWEYHQITTTNGVPAAPVVTPTTIACQDEPPLDIEQVRQCSAITNTIHVVTTAFDAAGNVVAVISEFDTGEDCHQNCGDPQCAKWSLLNVQLDNTGTLFSEDIEFTIENSDGSIDVFNVGPVANWSDQVVAIAAAMDAIYSGTYDPRCTFSCGGLLPPPTDAPAQPGIFARYINGIHCPTDLKVPIKATAVRASGAVVTLPLAVVQTAEKRGWVCPDCCATGEPVELLDENFEPVPAADLPACWFTCAETIPEPPLPACTSESFTGCDFVVGVDPDDDDEIVQTDVIMFVTTCGSDQTIDFMIVDDEALVDYPLVGDFVDCDTLEPFAPPPPPCPEGAVFECGEITSGYGILDNSLWDNGVNHLPKNANLDIQITYADGSTCSTGPLAEPYFNNFIKAIPAACPDCKVVPVCANHTSPKGCNVGHVANLAAYPAYDAPTAPGDVQNNLANPALAELWATGWLLDCACGKVPVRAEIIASTDAAWIGVGKDIIGYTKSETVYYSVNCDGTFWKDCDGNDIAEPAGGICCVKPCAAPSDLDQFATECCITPALEDSDRFCQTLPADTFEGDITMDGSVVATLAAGWTPQDLIDQLTASTDGVYFIDGNGALCSPERPPTTIISGQTCTTNADGSIFCTLFRVAKPWFGVIGEEEECHPALRVESCLDPEILQALTDINVSLPTGPPPCCGDSVPGGAGATAIGSVPRNADFGILIGGSPGPLTASTAADFPNPPAFEVCQGSDFTSTAMSLNQTGTSPTITVDVDSIEACAAGIGFYAVDSVTGLALPLLASGDWTNNGDPYVADSSTGSLGVTSLVFDSSAVANIASIIFVAGGLGGFGSDTTCCDEFAIVAITPPAVECADVLQVGDACVADKLDTLIALQSENNALLATLAECLCGPCGPELDEKCQSYSHPLASGYDNWRDASELADLASEFGHSSDGTIYLRITEHDCDGTAQSTVGQVFGPYTPGTPSAVDQAMADLNAATSSSCITVSPNGTGGAYGAQQLDILTSSSVTNATLVVQEGVGDGAGGVNWFTSSQGWTKRGIDVGDFIFSGGASPTFATLDQATIEGRFNWAACEL